MHLQPQKDGFFSKDIKQNPQDLLWSWCFVQQSSATSWWGINSLCWSAVPVWHIGHLNTVWNNFSLTEKLCLLLLCMLLAALNSTGTTVQLMFWYVDYWWAWSTVLASWQVSKHQYVEWSSTETPATGNDNLLTHCRGIASVITDHDVSDIVDCVPRSYGVFCVDHVAILRNP